MRNSDDYSVELPNFDPATGGISVFSTLSAFERGIGAKDDTDERCAEGLMKRRTICIFRNIEPAKHHDRIFSAITSNC